MPSRDASAALRPLPSPRSLVQDAADMIREQILEGGFQQGEHLVEARIAQQLHVSRGPVREAFKLLRAEGSSRASGSPGRSFDSSFPSRSSLGIQVRRDQLARAIAMILGQACGQTGVSGLDRLDQRTMLQGGLIQRREHPLVQPQERPEHRHVPHEHLVDPRVAR